MKLTEVRIDRTKNLGAYENLKLGFTAIVDEDEKASEAVERLKAFLDWEINKEERDIKYAKFKAIEEPTEAEQKWIAMYEERLAEMEKF